MTYLEMSEDALIFIVGQVALTCSLPMLQRVAVRNATKHSVMYMTVFPSNLPSMSGALNLANSDVEETTVFTEASNWRVLKT